MKLVLSQLALCQLAPQLAPQLALQLAPQLALQLAHFSEPRQSLLCGCLFGSKAKAEAWRRQQACSGQRTGKEKVAVVQLL